MPESPETCKQTASQAQASPAFTFIDLFAGIGGLRLGFEAAGGQCVHTSEWNAFSQKTYLENFGEQRIEGDITKIEAAAIPPHDVLLAGFPCQPFSIAGVSRKNALGRPHGFACAAQGTLFFDVARILAELRPPAFLLENVKNLASHDRGNTFRIIRDTLQEELGYDLHYRVLDACHFVPQHRERIFLAGFAQKCDFSFDAVAIPSSGPRLSQVLHRTDGTEPFLRHDGDRFFDHDNRRVRERYTLSSRLWTYLQNYAEKHRARGNGFGYGLFGPDDLARTLSARYYKDGSEILIRQEHDRPRRLTPRECARLMGFPDSFRIPVSDMQAYRQFGNSVVVPLVSAIARAMLPYIRK